ncbi:glycosyltransferase family 2 protein [Patescibacteria group bacterium]|nr:glycosyltransferase family 2 protein [Patescibacteria group bacterium]
MKSKKPELSVVALCFQEGEAAAQFANRLNHELSREKIDYEIVLVSNYIPGIKDSTPALVTNIAKNNPRIKAVTEAKSKGQHFGWDVRQGLNVASGTLLCFVDGDNQIPPKDVVRVYRNLKEKRLDLVKGRRVERHDGLQRILISKVYNLIFWLLFPSIADGDVDGKPKIFTRELYERLDLQSNDWFVDPEIMIQAKYLGFAFDSVPTVFQKKPHRSGSLINFHTSSMLKNLIRWRIKTLLNKRL